MDLLPSFICVLVLFLPGLWIAAHGVGTLRLSRQLRRIGSTAEAVVVRTEEEKVELHDEHGSSTAVNYRPYLRFTTNDGRVVNAQAQIPTGYRVPAGTRVTLLYHPKHPTRMEVISGPGKGHYGVRQLVWGLLAMTLGLPAVISFVAAIWPR